MLKIQVKTQSTTSETRCEENEKVQYIFVERRLNFDDADDFCRNQVTEPAVLAEIPDEVSFKFLENFLLEVANEGQPWIGLRRRDDDFFPQGTDLTDPDPGLFFIMSTLSGMLTTEIFHGKRTNQTMLVTEIKLVFCKFSIECFLF